MCDYRVNNRSSWKYTDKRELISFEKKFRKEKVTILFYKLLPSKESHLHVIPGEDISDAIHLRNVAFNLHCVIGIHDASLLL
jgi:hypothetical protein